MAATSMQILQTIRNRIDTAESGWLAFGEAATQAYDAAYKTQQAALSAARVNLVAQQEQAWKVLNILLAISSASWVPKLLAPVKKYGSEAFGIDEVTTAWVADAVRAGGDELVKEMKGSALAAAKSYLGKTSDAFEPVVENTLNYASRLKEGIYQRAESLKRKMDDVVAEADQWSVKAATALQKGFFTGCPFLTDEPKDVGEDFKTKFQNDAELSMWVDWAIARDEKYWKHAESVGAFHWDPYANDERHSFDPIRDRLVALGVPINVTRGSFFDQDGHPSTWQPPLDMVALIDWAKNRSRSIAAQQVCRPVQPVLLKLRQENRSVMGQ